MAAGSELFYVIANAISKPVLQRGKAHQSLWYDEAFRCDLIVVQIHVVVQYTLFVKHNKQHFQAHKADAAGWEKLLQENKLMIKCIIDKDYGEAFVFVVFHCCFFVSIVA